MAYAADRLGRRIGASSPPVARTCRTDMDASPDALEEKFYVEDQAAMARTRFAAEARTDSPWNVNHSALDPGGCRVGQLARSARDTTRRSGRRTPRRRG